MSTTTTAPEKLNLAQREHINAALAMKAPGTRIGDVSIKTARALLTGEGFTDEQVDYLLALRVFEIKHAPSA